MRQGWRDFRIYLRHDFPSHRLRQAVRARRYRRRHPWQFTKEQRVQPLRDHVPHVPPSDDLKRRSDQAPSQAHPIEDDSVRDQTYWVIERGGVWIVRHDDVEIASLPGRPEAVAAAVMRAENDQPSEVVILGPDGAIEEKHSFGG